MSPPRGGDGRVKHELQYIIFFAATIFSAVLAQVPTIDRTRYPCPRSCSQNPKQSGWSSFYQLDRLAECDEPMLLTVNTFTPVDDPGRQLKIRACTTGNADTTINALTGISAILTTGNSSQPSVQNAGRIARREDLDDPDEKLPVCYGATTANATAQWLSWSSRAVASSRANMIASLKDSQKFLENKVNCGETVIYGSLKGSLVGVYVGSHLQNTGIATGFIQGVIDRLSNSSSKSYPTRTVAQVCGVGHNSDDHVGVVTDPDGDLAWVQRAVRSWAEARCVNESSSQGFKTVTSYTASIASNSGNSTKTRRAAHSGQCHQVQAVHGDTIQSIATRCFISIGELRDFNHLPAEWKPAMHQWLCCSSGGLSRREAPKPRPDGTCVSYVITNHDDCSKIQANYGISKQEIYDYNKETWAWAGCDGILPGQRICVGPGTPRLPPPDPQAECGPSKPGTSSPSNGEKMGDLSPCPIKACCNVWGNCGVDKDFCIPTTSETGNPGSAAPNTNGCVQNCGMEIVKSGGAPASFMKVGYFEAWNRERPCLHMSPGQIPSGYTHIHYAFADITPGFGVGLNRFSDVFEQFKSLQGMKRIVAFGGWAFSTEPATYQFFRNAVKPENRATFADACVAFVNSHGLDGVDFDWEYPAEPDIPGIPAGDVEESQNYLEFVKVVKSKMPAGKTVSIAAPASYWYLKQFLIEDMAKVVDYIIYMTYDLHGQWDYGHKWTQSGCGEGDCLRSHINMTETLSSLAMVTKAGVPSAKIIVGVSSYGRSFKMTDPSCSGPDCRYTGPESGAEHGKCTETGGYISNGEISAISSAGRITKRWTDDTQTDYVVFGDTWVAYMSDSNKQARTRKYQSLGFGGTSDWAIDLEGDVGGTSDPQVVYLGPPIYSGTPAQCIPPCLFVLPPSPLPSATTITIPPYTTSLQIDPGTVSTITVKPHPLTVTSIEFWNVNISIGSTTGFIQPSYSLDLPPYVTTVRGDGGLIYTRTLSLPPWPLITNGPPDTWNFTSSPGLTSSRSTPRWKWPPRPENPTPVTLPPINKPKYTGPTYPDPDPTPTWPSLWDVVPVPTPVKDEGEDDDGNGSKSKSTCKLWFFFVCIRWGGPFNIDIQGWEWNIPVGVWGPGPPPPNIEWPSGLSVRGTLPPWPKITVHPGGSVEAGPKPADCTPAEAALCMTTQVFGTTVTGGSTKTTATSVTETCATITGCNLRDVDATTKVDACTIQRRAVRATDLPEPEEQATPRTDQESANIAKIKSRAEPSFDWSCERQGEYGFLWPKNPDDQDEQWIIRTALIDRSLDKYRTFEVVESVDLGVTAFWIVHNMGQDAMDYFNSDAMPQVFLAYWPDHPVLPPHIPKEIDLTPVPRDASDKITISKVIEKQTGNNGTVVGRPRQSVGQRGATDEARKSIFIEQSSGDNGTTPTLSKRAMSPEITKNWWLSMTSWPRDTDFDKESLPGHHPEADAYYSSWDNSYGEGQTIYIWDVGIEDTNTEYSDRFSRLPSVAVSYPRPSSPPGNTEIDHGTWVAALAGGKTVGIAKKAKIVFAPALWYTVEEYLSTLVDVANAARLIPKDTCIVNASFILKYEQISNAIFLIMIRLMQAMELQYGCIFTIAAGNEGGSSLFWPARAWPHLKGMHVVGAVDRYGDKYSLNSGEEEISIYAPGVDITMFGKTESGTSLAAPQVAGLVAYLRALPSWPMGKDPKSMFDGIRQRARNIQYANKPPSEVPIIWNGHEGSCAPGSKRDLEGRQGGDGASCPFPGSGSGQPGGPQDPQGPPIEFKSGTPGPLCTAPNCGKLCSGFYCVPNPTGTPPDFSIPASITAKPTFTPAPGDACVSETTIRECNGGPRDAVCSTTTQCVSWGAVKLSGLPTPTSDVPFSPSGGSCISSTTWLSIGGPKFEATITKSSCAEWWTPSPPTPTPTPEPPAPLRCITAHLLIHTEPLGEDSFRMQLWDNGNRVECNAKGKHTAISDTTVLEYDCGGGGYAAITGNGANFKEYRAGDGWSVKPETKDYQHDTFPQSDNTWSSLFEAVYTGGDCSNCMTAELCGYDISCDGFEGTCSS